MALGGPGVKAPPAVADKSLIYRIFAGKMRSSVSLFVTPHAALQVPLVTRPNGLIYADFWGIVNSLLA